MVIVIMLTRLHFVALCWRYALMKSAILLLAVVMAFFCPTGLQAEIVYELIDLGTLGGDRSWADSINDAGQIVGPRFTQGIGRLSMLPCLTLPGQATIST